MSCADCATAAVKSWWGFTAGCRGCCARAAARSPHWRRVRDAGGALDRQYRQLLKQFALSHEEVRSAAQVDKVEAAHV